MPTIKRREFIGSSLLAALGMGAGRLAGQPARGLADPGTRRFFATVRRGGRHWFLTPEGELFWSVGLNHLDSAPLRNLENGELWREKYGNSMQRWLVAAGDDLRSWGFNTMGWNQELVSFSDYNANHSRAFTPEEYQWLGLPYGHLLPFIESHQWEAATRLPDLRSQGFADWCDYVARNDCARMRDDPNLIGYWYADCPTWVHQSRRTAWKAPLFDPELLQTPAGRRELHDLATTYYRVTTEAVRRYDPNHLIFGDRYEANRPLPEEVLSAARPFVDVFAFQCFGPAEVVGEKLGRWARFLEDKPLLLADNAPFLPAADQGWPPRTDRHLDAAEYGRILRALREIPQCVGFHLCGAYLRNNARRYGLKSARDELDPSTAGVQRENEAMHRWIAESRG
jgi:hypothetical protein